MCISITEGQGREIALSPDSEFLVLKTSPFAMPRKSVVNSTAMLTLPKSQLLWDDLKRSGIRRDQQCICMCSQYEVYNVKYICMVCYTYRQAGLKAETFFS